MDSGGKNKLQTIGRLWVAGQTAAAVLYALALGFLLLAICKFMGWQISTLIKACFLLLPVVAILLLRKPWAVNLHRVATYLDKHYPQLEESTWLLLKPEPQLNLLEKLQLANTTAELQNIPLMQPQVLRQVATSTIAFVIAIVLQIVAVNISPGNHSLSNSNSADKVALRPEVLLPQIANVKVTIHPPAYTRKAVQQQDRFNITAPENAAVSWQVGTNEAVKKVSLLFNDKEQLTLQRKSASNTWSVSKMLSKPGFYQVKINDKLSEIYAIQLIKDQPPVVQIRAPGQNTYLGAGAVPRIQLKTIITDDYGIAATDVVATVAKGSGEAVKFKDYQLNFGTAFKPGARRYQLNKMIDLRALDMAPGDELYLYLKATDSKGQSSRTDVHTVTMQDTAQLLSMDGMLTGVNQKPEFFRSQRQIIIDTESLLAKKDSTEAKTFRNSSNDIGVDQKLLRLRYGKFLGEEAEDGGDDLQDDDAIADVKNFGNAALIKDKYTDKHDNAEDATYFDPDQKKQLKAVLNEMWKAELQLRLGKPQAALPFEYKALTLLKDLQQKSRVFAAKTTFKSTPLDLSKRLSGELDKVITPVDAATAKPPADRQARLKQAAIILSKIKPGQQLSPAQKNNLLLARRQLAAGVSVRPGAYLQAINALQQIMAANKANNNDDVKLVLKTIEQVLTPPKPLPDASQAPADMGLGDDYFKQLKNHGQ